MMASLVPAALEHVWTVIARLNVPAAVVGGLILHKLLAGRAIDWADAVALLQENRDTLEVTSMNDSAAQLGVSFELSQAWQEAFPADPTE